MKVKFKTEDKNLIWKYSFPDDACFDLMSNEKINIPPNRTMVIKTGVKLEIPTGYMIEIKSRSSLASKGLLVQGIIDSGYRGEVNVIMYNSSVDTFKIDKYDRIAQGQLMPVVKAEFVEGELNQSERGTGGFGSSGK